MDIKERLSEKYGAEIIHQLFVRMEKVQPKDRNKWILKVFNELAEHNAHIQIDEVKKLISGKAGSQTRAYETNNNI